MRLLFSIVFILFIIKVYPAPPKKKIAILKFTTTNTEMAYANIIRNRLEYNFHETARYELLERNKINFKIDDFKLSATQGKDIEIEKELKIGKLLTADFVISGNIEFSTNYIVTIRIIDVKSGKLAAIKNNEFKNKNDLMKGTHLVSQQTIKAIDEVDVARIARKNRKIRMEMSVGYLKPAKKLKNNVKSGLTGTINLGVENFPFRNFFMGIKSGYYNLKSNDDDFDQAYMVPIFASFDYSITLFHPLRLIPSISGGASYNAFAKKAFEPALEAGASLSFDITLLTSIKLSYFYGTIFEEIEFLHYHNYSLGMAFYF